MISNENAYKLGFDHGFEMASESGSASAGTEGWDGLLINADPVFARKALGWNGQDTSKKGLELLAEYCRGAQDGANEAVGY